MPVTKNILKKTKRQAVVKLVGTGTATISIYELAYVGANTLATGSSIRLHDQSVTPANVQLTITDLFYDVSTTANIVRNGNVIWAMNPGQGTYNFTQEIGVSLDRDANANVIVNLGTSGADSSVLIGFTKGTGYNDIDLQNFQDFEK
jgi:hypothetical protein